MPSFIKFSCFNKCSNLAAVVGRILRYISLPQDFCPLEHTLKNSLRFSMGGNCKYDGLFSMIRLLISWLLSKSKEKLSSQAQSNQMSLWKRLGPSSSQRLKSVRCISHKGKFCHWPWRWGIHKTRHTHRFQELTVTPGRQSRKQRT